MKVQLHSGLKIAFFAFVFLMASILIFVISMEAWALYYTTVAYHSYLAFLSITAAAWAYSRIRVSPLLHHVMIFSVLIARSFIHIGAAIDHLYEQSPQILFETATRISSDILEILFIASIFLIAALIQHRKPFRYTSKKVAFPLTIGILAIDGLVYHIIFPMIPDSAVRYLGLIFGFLAILFMTVSGYIWNQNPKDDKEYASIWFLTSLIVFTIACLPLLYALMNPSFIWGLSMNLQATGFYAISLSISKTVRLDIGMNERIAFLVITALSILIFIPFIISLIIVSWIPGLLIMDFGAYLMSHIGSAVLSGVMAFLLYMYCKYKPEWYFYPLILCLATWAYADFHLVLLFQPEINQLLGESLVPYIVSSLITIFNLSLAIIWVINPPLSKVPDLYKWILPRIVIAISIILVGIMLEIIFLTEFVTLQGSPLGRSILILLNFFIPFLIVNLGVIIVRKTKSLDSAEVLALSFLALRIIPNILKGNFDDWSSGWWAAELVLLTGSLLGPAIFGSLYLRSTMRAEREKRRATLYSDLLVHDITNYHQAIQVALDLFEYEEIPSSMRTQAIEDAFLSLKRADHLIRNVRNIGTGESLESVLIESIDLVTCIKQAYNEALLVTTPEDIVFNIESIEGQHYVRANSLLVDVFLNLFRNSIQYSSDNKRIDIEIKRVTKNGKDLWQTRVIDYGHGISPEKKSTLFQRYMQGASGTGLGLSVVSSLIESYNGSIHVENRVLGDYTKGTAFVVNLHAVN